MVRNPQAIRNQLNRQVRDLHIFESRFIEEQSIFTISLDCGLSVRQIYRIIKHHRTRYEKTFNYIREKIFGLPPVKLMLKDMQNNDVLVATESRIALEKATISYFLDLAANKQEVLEWKKSYRARK